jgi:O-antigen/teichoic acid export membrane protein
MSKLIKNTIIYTIGNSLPMAVTFFLLPLYTKYMSPHEYGIVGTMDAVKIFFTIIFSLCIERSIVRLYWENKTETKKKLFLATIFFTLLTTSILGLILAIFFKNYIQNIFKNINFFPYIYYTILISFLSTFEHLPKLYYRLKEKAISFVLLSFTYFFLSTILIIWFVVFNKEGALGYLKGQLFASMFITTIYFIISLKISTFNFNFLLLKNIILYSIPFIPPLLVSWFINQSNRVFLENSVSLDAVGIFTFSNKLSIATSLFTTALMVSFEPNFYRLASGNYQDINKIKKFFNFFILTAIVSSFLFLFLIKEILFLFFDINYASTSNIIFLITLANIFGTGTGITGLFFQQSKKMIANMFISISAALLIFFLYYLLIPLFLIYGAAISLLITTMYAFITSYFYTKYNTFHVELPLFNYLILIIIFILLYLFFIYLETSFNFYFLLFFKISIIITIVLFFYKKYSSEILILTKKISS